MAYPECTASALTFAGGRLFCAGVLQGVQRPPKPMLRVITSFMISLVPP